MNLALDRRSSSRRRFFKQAAAAGLGGLLFEVPGLFAEQLTATPEVTEGPYYPTTLPLDTDNDLVVINSSLTSAVGQITYISGRIRPSSAVPVPLRCRLWLPLVSRSVECNV